MGGLLAVDEVLHEKNVGVGGGAIAFLKNDIFGHSSISFGAHAKIRNQDRRAQKLMHFTPQTSRGQKIRFHPSPFP